MLRALSFSPEHSRSLIFPGPEYSPGLYCGTYALILSPSLLRWSAICENDVVFYRIDHNRGDEEEATRYSDGGRDGGEMEERWRRDGGEYLTDIPVR